MAPHPIVEDVRAAAARITDIVAETPLRRSEWLSEETGRDVLLKLESEQVTGSFKARGAANTLLQLSEAERERGVVAVSSGNHGRAVAHVADRLGIRAMICLSSRVPSVKREAIEALGARVVVAGPDQDDADAAARRMVDEEGLVLVHPFDDPRVIAGQGTVALEILEQAPETAAAVVPLSGGGLAAGIALVMAEAGVPVIGASQERGPAMVESIAAGRIVPVVEEDTLADALAGGLGPANEHSFHLCRTLLAGTALVTESQIGAAMAGLARREGLTVEGGGAVGVAALRAGMVDVPGPVAVVVSGGNVAPETHERVLAEHA